MFRSILPSLTTILLLSGCATVPIASQGPRNNQPVRPVKDLMAGRGEITQPNRSQGKRTATLTNPSATPTASTKPGQPSSQNTIALQIQAAEDKATSARSMSQSAQNADDWKLVAQQWQKAIALLPTPPAKSPLFAKVQQARNTYTASLQSAQVQGSGTPKASNPIEIDPKDNSSRRGFILGGESSPSPSPQPSSEKPGGKPGEKPGEKATTSPKNNPSPAPSPKN
jgi:hypothetical protein